MSYFYGFEKLNCQIENNTDMKYELKITDKHGNEHLYNVVCSASNGFRPNVYIFDDLEDLKRRYTPEQLQKIWEDAYPKSSEISGKVITGTPK